MSTSFIESLPSSPILAHTDTELQYSINSLQPQPQLQPQQQPLTELETIAVEALLSFSSTGTIPPEQIKLMTLKGYLREFNEKMFAMPPTASSAQLRLASDTLRAILDSPLATATTLYYPPQGVWVPLFDILYAVVEQLPGGVELRTITLNMEDAFTSVLSAIDYGQINYASYAVVLLGNN